MFDLDTAQQLLDNGTISQGTYDSIASANGLPAASPVDQSMGVNGNGNPVPTADNSGPGGNTTAQGTTGNQSTVPSPAGLPLSPAAPSASPSDQSSNAMPPLNTSGIPSFQADATAVNSMPAPSTTAPSSPIQLQPAQPSNVMNGIKLPQIGMPTAGYNQVIQGGNESKTAIQNQADVEGKAATEIAGIQQQASDALQQKARTDEYVRQAQQADLSNRLNTLNTAAQQFSQLQIDPNRYWANKSTGGKILAVLGMGLSAMGKGTAVQLIDGAINRDIDAQKTNLENKRVSLNAQSGLLGQFQSLYRDDQLARSATTMTYLQNVKQQIEAISSKYTAPDLQAKAKAQIGQLDQQIGNYKTDFALRSQQLSLQNAQLQMQMQERQMANSGQAVDQRALFDPKNQERFVPMNGTVGYIAPDASSAGKARELNASYSPLIQGLSQYQQFLQQHPVGSVLNPIDRQQANALKDNLLTQYKDAAQVGRLGGESLSILKGVVPDQAIGGIVPNFAAPAVINKAIATLMLERNAKLRAYGVNVPTAAQPQARQQTSNP